MHVYKSQGMCRRRRTCATQAKSSVISWRQPRITHQQFYDVFGSDTDEIGSGCHLLPLLIRIRMRILILSDTNTKWIVQIRIQIRIPCQFET